MIGAAPIPAGRRGQCPVRKIKFCEANPIPALVFNKSARREAKVDLAASLKGPRQPSPAQLSGAHAAPHNEGGPPERHE